MICIDCDSINWIPNFFPEDKETQTEEKEVISQEPQADMQNIKSIMESQKQQMKDLEDRLQQQVSTNESLNAQLQDTA